MANGFDPPPNPFQSPTTEEKPGLSLEFNVAKVQAPAITLAILAGLGLLACIGNTIFALVADPVVVPPDAPEFIRSMQENSRGTGAAIVQALFAVLNGVNLFLAIQMARMRNWGGSMAVSILSMVNIGSCCCLLGFPVGIWSLVILLQGDVKQAFQEVAG